MLWELASACKELLLAYTPPLHSLEQKILEVAQHKSLHQVFH